MEFILPLLGRFHPLFVHLPIGILFLAALLVFLPSANKSVHLPAIRVSLLAGGIFALASCISGFLQYQNEGYTWETVRFHLILGWITALGALVLYLQFKKITSIEKSSKWKITGLLLVLTITGHLGGNITHGDSYFIEVLPPNIQAFLGEEIESEKGLELPQNGWEEMAYFDEVVQPILNQNCKSCHNPRNLKGELDLSSFQALLKGGEDGTILVHGKALESELFSRLMLPKEDEHHMPPAEKRQPKKEEIELIRLWIESGGNQDLKLGDVEITADLLDPFFIREEKPFYPTSDIPALAADILDSLRSQYFFAEPIASNSNWIEVSTINFPQFTDVDFLLLSPAKSNIVSLDLSDTQISSQALDSLATFPNLTILKLNRTGIKGENLAVLKNCKNLKFLYLNGLEISIEQLAALQEHQSLEKVYFFNSTSEPIPAGLSFKIERGNYSLPPIPTDTIDYLKD